MALGQRVGTHSDTTKFREEFKATMDEAHEELKEVNAGVKLLKKEYDPDSTRECTLEWRRREPRLTHYAPPGARNPTQRRGICRSSGATLPTSCMPCCGSMSR